MTLKCGIVGLPNVGKSTLFNALTKSKAAAANYPFCTIDPNVGNISVPDKRLEKLAEIANSARVIYSQIEFVDIAGLVKGASKGEGLGNQFLGHIREVDSIIYVLRCFESSDIIHVEGEVDPLRDASIIETELMISDLESLEKRIPAMEKKAKQEKQLIEQVQLMKECLSVLSDGKKISDIPHLAVDANKNHLNLITSKPSLYVCNVSESDVVSGNKYVDLVKDNKKGENVLIVSAQIESEICLLENDEEKLEFLSSLGLSESGLDTIIKSGYNILDLITYFTVGKQEARAWTIMKNTTAPKAAGVIHTDFEKGFICAETISYEDYIECRGEQKAKELGKMRLEGRDYVVKDGDVMLFRFNV